MNKPVIVSISGGNSSAVAAHRAIEKYGKENVEVVFCDTLWEDDDLYRFLDEVEKYLGIEITRLSDGRNPLQVFEKEQLIPDNLMAPCSKKLKIDMMKKHVKERLDKGIAVTMVIGFDYRDAQPRGGRPQGRLPGTTAAWEAFGVKVEYPLLDEPIVLDSGAVVESWGIKQPRMYAMGYTHNNCGGRCIKQGKGDWRRTLENFPERYQEVETWEKEAQIRLNKERTILRDTRKGMDNRLSLAELREETLGADIKERRRLALEDDMGQVCGIECGIGSLED